jgi:hypothetical protein
MLQASRVLVALWCIFALSPARAELNGPGSTVPFTASGNGATTGESDAARWGTSYNIVGDGFAVGDAKSYAAGSVAASSCAFSSSSATFTVADIGKGITIDGVGSGGGPLATTIRGFTDSHDVALANCASFGSSGNVEIQWAFASTPGSGYVPGEVDPCTGGTGSVACAFTIETTLVSSSSVASGGSGGTASNGTTTGTCVLYGTTGSGVKAEFAATLTSGVVTAVTGPIVGQAGQYTTNPTSLSAEPVIGCGALSGATLSLSMGVAATLVSTRGVYSSAPTTFGVTSAGGSGAAFAFASVALGQFTYGTDDTSAFTAAFNLMNAASVGAELCLVVPSGRYFVRSNLPTLTNNPCIHGDGSMHSEIIVDSAMSGRVIALSDNWLTGNAPTQGVADNQSLNASAHLEGFSIHGDTLAPATQDALVFADWNDFVYMRDVQAHYINGHALLAGLSVNAASSSLRESTIDGFRATNCGNASVPCVEISATGSGDGSNEIQIFGLNIFAVNGRGLVIRNAGGVATRLMNFFGLRVEGVASTIINPPIAGDLITIGDPTLQQVNENIFIYGLHTASPYAGYQTIRVTGPSASYRPANVLISGGVIGPGNGGGVSIDAAQNVKVSLSAISATGIGFTVGPTSLVAGEVTVDLNGGETALSEQIDYSSAGIYGTPSCRRVGASNAQSGSLVCNYHDGTSIGGNQVGTNAIDFETSRTSNANACTGANGVCIGQDITGSGTSFTCIGSYNSCTGARSAVLGVDASDKGRYAVLAFAAGDFAAAGDQQWTLGLLAGTGTGTSALRALAGGASSANTVNCGNITTNNSGYALKTTMIAYDITTSGKMITATWGYSSAGPHQYTRGSGSTSVLIDSATSTISPDGVRTQGTLTGYAATIAPDTTNGCLNENFTPPTSNADTWYFEFLNETLELP